jgi:ABC-type phosphate transport system ATPase subunit
MADSPYLGPRPFGRTDDNVFFGRRASVAHILKQLREHRVIFVVGPTGVGKSSLVRAGVIPNLVATEGEKWLNLTIRFGGEALANLTNALLSISSRTGDTNVGTSRLLREALGSVLI